jgi:hypothetical protein
MSGTSSLVSLKNAMVLTDEWRKELTLILDILIIWSQVIRSLVFEVKYACDLLSRISRIPSWLRFNRCTYATPLYDERKFWLRSQSSFELHQ